ncbi:ABC transporter ATP-binding protein [Paenibacillus sp. MMS18-CY102]|uniref:ABC transporter ATP-binding protein n=1 Tax=Paenibacillus sp. MMS18-CY102 TaxID=2682849 RepID=UPI001365CFB1|nr:ABC transporter ATP-binding protein [Paenibacillus sp. MMS18-CY102]MWC28124.1 ATP-binding cassette domain-containing protein [Paenibacillus sp. MMS18-CY102]
MLCVDQVDKSYKTGGMFSTERRMVLNSISFECGQGECLAVIGESGSGKSTLGRLILGMEKPDRGTVLIRGKRVENRTARLGAVSAVFQDYTSSIHPFYTVEQALLEPMKLLNVSRQDAQDKLDLLLEQVGLHVSYRAKYPHELSGGEAQRVCIARAVATEPDWIVLDEATGALDGIVQRQVLELLKSIRKIYGTGLIFITHDIQAAAYISDRVLILRNGRVEEIALVSQLKDVQSDYAKQLLRMALR